RRPLHRAHRGRGGRRSDAVRGDRGLGLPAAAQGGVWPGRARRVGRADPRARLGRRVRVLQARGRGHGPEAREAVRGDYFWGGLKPPIDCVASLSREGSLKLPPTDAVFANSTSPVAPSTRHTSSRAAVVGWITITLPSVAAASRTVNATSFAIS